MWKTPPQPRQTWITYKIDKRRKKYTVYFESSSGSVHNCTINSVDGEQFYQTTTSVTRPWPKPPRSITVDYNALGHHNQLVIPAYEFEPDDEINPTVSHSMNSYGTVATISAYDRESGIDYLVVDGSKIYSSTKTIDKPAYSRIIEYYAVDKAGNISSTGRIYGDEWDFQDPTVSHTVDVRRNTYTITASDSKSGVKRINVNGSWYNTSSKTFNISTPLRAISYYAEDNAGNTTSTKKILPSEFDSNPPTVIVTADKELNTWTKPSEGFSFTVQASDAETGISKIEYKIE